MSQKWNQRKDRLRQLLHSYSQHEQVLLKDEFEQEDADGLALDRLLHGQTVIGPTPRTKEIDYLRFGDADLKVLGTLERGQYGVIDVVSYRHSCDKAKLYIRKTVSKPFSLRTRHQNSPTTERLLLLLAHRTNTPWAPHLIAAFHTSTHLSLIIPYAPLGSLWDLLSSSPLSPVRIREEELKWWVPQVICAIAWCHDQGYAHRDVKPHNFVITEEKKILILDFGSAAPAHGLDEEGHRILSKEHCQMPVGTCDYVSPEILKAHEVALVQLELEEDAEVTSRSTLSNGGAIGRTFSSGPLTRKEDEVYGLETDWWSMGAMVYELAFGIAPFFAEDIGKTYLRIMDFKRSLRFDTAFDEVISDELKNLLKGVLTDAEFRIGRERGLEEFREHPWFDGVKWDTLHQERPLEALHLPQFVYADPNLNPTPNQDDMSKPHLSHSEGFAFSAFFQSSYTTIPTNNSILGPQQAVDGNDQGPVLCGDDPALVTPSQAQDRKQTMNWSTPGLSILHSHSCSANDNSAAAWIGFSWGPKRDAFTPETEAETEIKHPALKPRRSHRISLSPIPISTPQLTNEKHGTPFRTPMPIPTSGAFRTPFRTPYQTQTLPIYGYSGGAGRLYTSNPRMGTPGPRIGVTSLTGTCKRRPISDRQAMAKLVDCIGMSARKRVEESGRKCRILNIGFTPADAGDGGGGGATSNGARGFDLKRFASGLDFAPSTGEAGTRATRGKSEGSEKKLRFALKDDIGGDNEKSGYAEYSSLAFSDVNTVDCARRPDLNNGNESEGELFFQSSLSQSRSQISHQSRSRSLSHSFSLEQAEGETETEETDLESTTTTSVPPSPSPSPRPGSATSGTLLSGLGGLSGGGWGSYGRSGTPTLTMTFFGKNGREKFLRSTSATGQRIKNNPRTNESTTTSERLHQSSSSSAASYTSVLDAPLDGMGEKYVKLMRDIDILGSRLRSVMNAP
ncbi:hypothetical protein E1B28_006033 [Marasmius oreades]|uniref:Protein kinase domain-containing protein n=1 Tax=Marasmius oreades TaxID=181124 RepID=A0A9P7S519_9AGAR|nr:uncharacterized protein E1B28_006033 [Marasmius oreades]KAG7095260.1 hypothetical protein E1B28_006033 [Marasmius oreades]